MTESENIPTESDKEFFDRLLDEKVGNLSTDDTFRLAVNYLKVFVGANFAGITEIDDQITLGEVSADELRQFGMYAMSFDSNKPSPVTRHIEYLWAANRLIQHEAQPSHFASEFETKLWRFRALHVWSMILAERSDKLKERIELQLTELDRIVEDNLFPNRLLIQFLLEKAHFKLEYLQPSEAKLALDKALQLAGIQLELGGALGRRTKFQLRSLPQLTLQISLDDSANSMEKSTEDVEDSTAGDLPHNCRNQDDTMLETVVYDDPSLGERKALNEEQIACVLVKGLVERRLEMRESKSDELMVYIDEVIGQRRCWAIQMRALIERSSLELDNSRRVDRACSQLETVAKLLDGPSGALSSNQMDRRIDFLLSSAPLPFFKVRKLHAKVLLSLGCFSQALCIFEGLQMWDDVVDCYRKLRQTEKAETLIRSLLAQKEDPVYYCLLGDITNDAAYYETAINVDEKCARAHSSWASLLISQKKYSEALSHYQSSVELQPFQLGVWFNLGYCAMKLGKHSEAIRAFHRCVSVEPEHFEAWNNLAASYLNAGQKARAQKIFLEALKLNYDNAKVWENLLLISTDIGDFAQALSAMERLLDLRGRLGKVDELPLEIIATEVLEAGPEADADVQNIKKKLLPIIARVKSRQTLSAKVLRLYTELKQLPSES